MAKKRRSNKFTQKTIRLKDNHTWKAPPGHGIVVLDRGAVRFNIPQKWVVVPELDRIEIYDAPQPKDECRLAASYLRLPPGIDWSELPMAQLMAAATKDEEGKRSVVGEMILVLREDLELAWAEVTWTDPVEHREARSRIAIARGSNLQALITMDFWPEDAARLEPVWKEVLRSIELGRYVSDPTQGDVLH